MKLFLFLFFYFQRGRCEENGNNVDLLAGKSVVSASSVSKCAPPGIVTSKVRDPWDFVLIIVYLTDLSDDP